MTAPSERADVTPTLQGLVSEWEFGCCAPRPVVGGTTWWHWTFVPELEPVATPAPDRPAVFAHSWSLSSSVELPDDSVAIELTDETFIAWWLPDRSGEFVWSDDSGVVQRVPVTAVASLLGRQMKLRGRLLGARHGGGPSDRLGFVGARVRGLTVLGQRNRIEGYRSSTTIEHTSRRDPKGPPRFWSYPENAEPPVEYRETSLVMELEPLSTSAMAAGRVKLTRPDTLPVGDLRQLLSAVTPLAVGQVMTGIRHVAQRNPSLPSGYRPPRYPDEWTTQDTDLMDDRTATTLHRRTRVLRIGPTPDHPAGAEREEFADGTPLFIVSGRRRWRFCHWPTDSWFVPGDEELTAVVEDLDRAMPPTLPPRPSQLLQLLAGEDPVGPIRSATVGGRQCWRFAMAGPKTVPWAVTDVAVDADTGWLVAEVDRTFQQVQWTDVAVGVDTPADWSAVTWSGPSRTAEWFRNDWVAVHPVRPT